MLYIIFNNKTFLIQFLDGISIKIASGWNRRICTQNAIRNAILGEIWLTNLIDIVDQPLTRRVMRIEIGTALDIVRRTDWDSFCWIRTPLSTDFLIGHFEYRLKWSSSAAFNATMCCQNIVFDQKSVRDSDFGLWFFLSWWHFQHLQYE